MKRFAVLLIAFILLTGCARTPQESPDAGTAPPESAATSALTPPPTPSPALAATPGPAQPDATTPVLIGGLLVGGLDHGVWTAPDVFYRSQTVDFDGFVYDVYVDGEKIGQAEGELPVDFLTGEPIDPAGDLALLSDINLHDANGRNVEYDIAIRADWELFPRKHAEQNTDSEEYQVLVEGLLTEEGLSEPVTALRQIVTVDLDGDGSEEVLIAADNTSEVGFDRAKKGDNALLVLHRTVEGQPVDEIVDSHIVDREPLDDTPFLYTFTVETCADLDGDGILEVVVKAQRYEGTAYAVYKLTDDGLKRVAHNSAGI